jgi:hypothetical protein
MKLLNEIFGEYVICRNLWPPRSLDLTPQVLYLWGAAKSAVFCVRPRTLNELKSAVTVYIRNISQADLQKVFADKIKQVQACIDTCGLSKRTALVIDAWIKPGTMVISDYLAVYRDLDAQGYMNRAISYSIGFIDQPTGAHTNTIESMWPHVKAFLSTHNRKRYYLSYLAHYMFAGRCRAEQVDQFSKFLHLVTTGETPPPPPLESCTS